MSCTRRLAVTLRFQLASCGRRPGVPASVFLPGQTPPPLRTALPTSEAPPYLVAPSLFTFVPDSLKLFPRERLSPGLSGQARPASMCSCVRWQPRMPGLLVFAGVSSALPQWHARGCSWLSLPARGPLRRSQPHSSLLGARGSPFEEEESGVQGTLSPETPPAAQVTAVTPPNSRQPHQALESVPSPSRPAGHLIPWKTLWGRNPCVGSVRLGALRSAALCDSSELS